MVSNRTEIRKLMYTLIILLFLFLIFYLRLFLLSGFLSFGNFSETLNMAEATQFYPFFNPFSNFGSVISSPLSTITYWFISFLFMALPSHALGLYVGTKIYIYVTSVIYGLSFYLFTSIFTKNYLSRLISTLFFLFNPFTIQLYSQGDFSPLIFQASMLIGMTFLYNATTKGKPFHPYYIISALFIVLSFSAFEFALTGMIFSIIIIAYASLFNGFYKGVKHLTSLFLKNFLNFFLPMGLLTFSLFVIPLLYSPASFLPGSTSALPLSTFTNNSLNIFKVITLNAYPPSFTWMSVMGFYGPRFYLVWYYFEALMIIMILVSYIFCKDTRLVFFNIIIIILALFASETAGPLGKLTIYLYLHFPGYQAINYPYLWVWLLLIPIFCINLSIIFANKDLKFKERFGKSVFRSRPLGTFRFGIRGSRTFEVILAVVIAFVLLAPTINQGYYGSNGIRQANMPTWFNTLDHTLVNLTQKNNSGVVFNTVNSYIFFGNNESSGIGNLLQAAPQFKTTSISSYIPNHSHITDFFYWFYNLFYTNETKYSSEILSTVGVQYFVDIYNTNSEGYPYFADFSYDKNASLILNHQIGWQRIDSTSNYSIFKNEYYNGNDYYSNNLSLVLGNYNTLNSLTYFGINPGNLTSVFPTDFQGVQQFKKMVNFTKLLILNGNNSIYDLVTLFSDAPKIYPTDFINGEITNENSAWINSENSFNYPDYGTLTPFAETYGRNEINIPFTLNQTGNYTLLFKLYFSNTNSLHGGNLAIKLNGKTVDLINTENSPFSENNRFLWVKIGQYLDTGRNVISFQSLSGFNAVKQIGIMTNKNYNSSMNETRQLLLKDAGKIIMIQNPLSFSNNKNGNFIGKNLGDTFPGGDFAYFNGSNRNQIVIDAPFQFTGDLVLYTLSIGATHMINISSKASHESISFYPSVYSTPQSSKSGRIFIPLHNTSNVHIQFSKGVDIIGPIILLPNTYLPHIQKKSNAAIGNVTYMYQNSSIKGLNLSFASGINASYIKGNFSYQNDTNYYPLYLDFSKNYSFNCTPLVSINVTGPGEFYLNGVSINASTRNTLPLISSQLNDQSPTRDKKINLEFVPSNFNSNKSLNISFQVIFYGFSLYNLSKQQITYSPISIPKLNYTLSGIIIQNSQDGILVVRIPFQSGLLSKYELISASNGLNTLVLPPNNTGEIVLRSYSYNIFVDSILLITSYVALSIGFYFIIINRRLQYSNDL